MNVHLELQLMIMQKKLWKELTVGLLEALSRFKKIIKKELRNEVILKHYFLSFNE
jgi:hypothetical protein